MIREIPQVSRVPQGLPRPRSRPRPRAPPCRHLGRPTPDQPHPNPPSRTTRPGRGTWPPTPNHRDPLRRHPTPRSLRRDPPPHPQRSRRPINPGRANPAPGPASLRRGAPRKPRNRQAVRPRPALPRLRDQQAVRPRSTAPRRHRQQAIHPRPAPPRLHDQQAIHPLPAPPRLDDQQAIHPLRAPPGLHSPEADRHARPRPRPSPAQWSQGPAAIRPMGVSTPRSPRPPAREAEPKRRLRLANQPTAMLTKLLSRPLPRRRPPRPLPRSTQSLNKAAKCLIGSIFRNSGNPRPRRPHRATSDGRQPW